jgi:hypothetical protein
VDILAWVEERCFGHDVSASTKAKDHGGANDSGEDRAVSSIEEGEHDSSTENVHHEFVLHIAMIESPAKAETTQLEEEKEEGENEEDRAYPAKHRREAGLDEVKDVLKQMAFQGRLLSGSKGGGQGEGKTYTGERDTG